MTDLEEKGGHSRAFLMQAPDNPLPVLTHATPEVYRGGGGGGLKH